MYLSGVFKHGIAKSIWTNKNYTKAPVNRQKTSLLTQRGDFKDMMERQELRKPNTCG